MRKERDVGKKVQISLGLSAAIIFFLLSYSPTLADEYEPTPTPTPPAIEYKLPYPGLLPDNPLYFLKSFRDNMMSFFIGKPVDKAKFALLESDKKVAASYLLVTQEQRKTDLAETTFSDAQDYFEEAIKQTLLAHKQGTNTDDLAKKLDDANQKHFQVLHEIEQQVTDSNKKKFQDERNRADGLAKEVKSLQPK